jgi:F0F1-type ATP synthase beta subunit
LRGCEEILEGHHDELPEQAFYMIGDIDEAVSKAQRLEEEGQDRTQEELIAA